jgi:hypothetical protein
MPYRNPIVAGTQLVRAAIQSQDYAAGVSGWIVGRDGSAEFNNVTIRGPHRRWDRPDPVRA